MSIKDEPNTRQGDTQNTRETLVVEVSNWKLFSMQWLRLRLTLVCS